MDDQAGNQMVDLAEAPTPVPLAADALRWRCDPTALPFASTKDIEPIVGVVGQDCAVEALRFGLEVDAPGQNVFVRGLTGTGRMTLVRRLLEEIRPVCPQAQDRCYVHNFTQPERPRLITLPRGQADLLRRRVDELADFIRGELEQALGSEGLKARFGALEQDAQRQITRLVEPFEKKLREKGLSLVSVESSPVAQAALFPLVEGKPVPPEEWERLRACGQITEEEADRVRKQVDSFQQELRSVMHDVSEVRRKHTDAARTLRGQAARTILDTFVHGITEDFSVPEVRTFLKEIVDDVVSHRVHGQRDEWDFTRMYRVNVLLGHPDDASCPTVIENAPTMSNLLGAIDYRADRGEAERSDHLMIRGGSLLRADGGYLILDARDVLREPNAWKVLVRTLRTGRLEIVPPELDYHWRGSFLKPEPIDVNVKVILLGDAATYYMLDEYDPDFPHLFKVLADFDSIMPRNEQGVAQYCGVLARIVKEEKLPHLTNTAIAALLEHGARIASRNDRLTTRFGRLADVAREAAFIARKSQLDEVTGDHVRRSIQRVKDRANLPSKHFREALTDGTIRVVTKGEFVGQVNGLAVIKAGPLTYGFPTRITATIGPGSAGVINIEREAELSGAIHTKGFYILGGLLRYLLRTVHPLAFHASIAFEQSYGGIDGDSASAAEMCCLLSALTDVTLRQDLAMTGAIDQVGNILGIGATNEKIEGFFDTCRETGLTGTQGVIIPRANARDLMLRLDVVEACAEGRFHIYAVDKFTEALELLTSVRAGERDSEGAYPDDSLLGIAVARAFEYWLKATQTIESMRIAQGESAAEDSPDKRPDSPRLPGPVSPPSPPVPSVR